MRNSRLPWLVVLFGALLALYSIYSYSFTDVNLVLSSWQPYWLFQQWMWQTIFANKVWLMALYLLLILGLFSCYWLIVKLLRQQGKRFVSTGHMWAYAVLLCCLLFSYNALSHDVFNYIFNAKLIWVYQENPHSTTALEYPNDEWTRFMHNTHTPAPYGYAWTALSLIPFIVGNQIFSATWILFRLFEILAIYGLYLSLQALSRTLFKRELYVFELAVLFLNPLFLIEVVGNMHNDVWMIFPAVLAVSAAVHHSRNMVKALVITAPLLAVSISVKFATVLLAAPIVLVLAQRTLVEKFIKQQLQRFPLSGLLSRWLTSLVEQWTTRWLPLICSLLLFIPLCMPRSQFFHPWYLVWSMAWLPLIKQKWWRFVLLAFSFSSMLRYLPWMWVDGFEQKTLLWQQLITWGVPVVFIMTWLLLQNHQLRKRS